MEYRVVLTEPALAELEGIFEIVIQEAPSRGTAWADAMIDALESLATMPNRCPLAREWRKSKRTVRCLLFGKGHGVYRCFYEVIESPKQVRVLRVRHGSRADLTPDQLTRPE